MNHSNSYTTAKNNSNNSNNSRSYKTASRTRNSSRGKSMRYRKVRSKSLPSKRTPRVPLLPRRPPVRTAPAVQICYALREQTAPNEELLRRNAIRAGILQPFPGEVVEANSRPYDPVINGQWSINGFMKNGYMKRRTLRRKH